MPFFENELGCGLRMTSTGVLRTRTVLQTLIDGKEAWRD